MPNGFDGIELGTIGRQQAQMKAMPIMREPLPHFGSLVVRGIIVNKEDFLFNFIAKPPGSICVPRSQFELAQKVFLEEFGSEDEWNSAIESGALTLAENYVPAESKKKWDPDLWYPDDATAEIWVADPPNLEEIVELSLRENQIHTRWEDRDKKSVLFVQPEDEARAREILRQIVESSPPQ
jgi:hypothetical protein